MLPAALIVVGALYAISSLFLFAFGTNLVVMAARVWVRGPRPKGSSDRPLPVSLPRVTVQLPIYNELYVSERIIDAAAALDYPAELLQIQVLDDSTDETSVLIAQAVERWRAQGVDIVHLHRSDRTGYKAGALAEGLKTATGEFVAIFDADFIPPTDYLARTIGHFADDDIAFVQARWGHVNRNHSWLTRLQALAIDGHFLVEQAGRGQAGYWFNFNGTAGVWRTEAIADAGGWKADTLTEDLDLSYRAYLAGWRAVYLEDLVVPAEVPAAISGFRRQQHRWARGSIECAVRLLPQVWRSSQASLGTKMQATLHLLAYGIHLMLLMLTIIYPFVIELAVRQPRFTTLYGAAYLLALSSLAPTIFFVTGRRQAGLPWLRELPRILVVSIFGSGLMVNTARAALQILTRPNPEFERTAKFGLESGDADAGEWTNKRYQLDVDRIVFAEAALGVYSFWAASRAFDAGNWGIFIWTVLFGCGLLGVVITTVGHSFAIWRNRTDRERSVARERALLELVP